SLLANHVEAVLEVIEANAPNRDVGEAAQRAVRPRIVALGLTGATRPLEPGHPPAQVAGGILELVRARRLAGLDALQQVPDPRLVLQVVLVEQGALEKVDVAASGPARSGSGGRPIGA